MIAGCINTAYLWRLHDLNADVSIVVVMDCQAPCVWCAGVSRPRPVKVQAVSIEPEVDRPINQVHGLPFMSCLFKLLGMTPEFGTGRWICDHHVLLFMSCLEKIENFMLLGIMTGASVPRSSPRRHAF